MIVTICNYKGGVAKTTTAYHLAAAAARRNVQPLLIDMDPQANLTRMCRARLPDHPTVADCLGGAHNPTATIREAKVYVSFDNLGGGYVVPAELSLENVSVGLNTRDFGRLTALTNAIQRGANGAPLIIIDTPPNAGALTLNALVASTHVLICAEPEIDAIDGANTMIKLLDAILAERGKAPALLGILATKVDSVIGRHADGLAMLQGPGMPPLLGEIPKRAGRDAEKALIESYRPIADQILAEGGLTGEGVPNARLAA